jgi:hypothetical protein
MNNQQSHAHHYVPQWFQKRFLPQEVTKFFYLDLHPETVTTGAKTYTRKSLLRWGPSRCFYKDDFYTLSFGKQTTDEMEKMFFGPIDNFGRDAVSQFAEFEEIGEGTGKAFQTLTAYMGAQRFRTPRGLDELRTRASRRDGPNAALIALGEVFQAYATMWGEGIWEIVRARKSSTKFLLTDDPVTFYRKWVFPSEWTYPDDVNLKSIGTRTLFPLGLDSCLIITHLQMVRNPWSTPTEFRENARYYGQAMKHLGTIQFGRELEEDEVLRINCILKRRASRYIAAAEEEWLYPERRASSTEWQNLDDDWFLLPYLWRVHFTTGIFAGSDNGPKFAADEHGRHPGHPLYDDEKLREREWVTFERAKREWARKRVGKSRAKVDERIGRDVADEMMDDYLREQGLLV